MPKNWQDELREILDQADKESPVGPRRSRGVARPGSTRSGNVVDWLSALGEWIRRRVATTNDMLVAAASLVVIALLLSIVFRQAAAVLAVAGALLFALALGRAIIQRRSGRARARPRGPVMWRGQVIDLPKQDPTLGDRLRAWWRRRR